MLSLQIPILLDPKLEPTPLSIGQDVVPRQEPILLALDTSKEVAPQQVPTLLSSNATELVPSQSPASLTPSDKKINNLLIRRKLVTNFLTLLISRKMFIGNAFKRVLVRELKQLTCNWTQILKLDGLEVTEMYDNTFCIPGCVPISPLPTLC
jgi:hypothetical protein